MTTVRSEWEIREALGEMRYTQGQYKCVGEKGCGRWHTVRRLKMGGGPDRLLTLTERIVRAARTARMRGCQVGRAHRKQEVEVDHADAERKND